MVDMLFLHLSFLSELSTEDCLERVVQNSSLRVKKREGKRCILELEPFQETLSVADFLEFSLGPERSYDGAIEKSMGFRVHSELAYAGFCYDRVIDVFRSLVLSAQEGFYLYGVSNGGNSSVLVAQGPQAQGFSKIYTIKRC